MLYVEGKRIRHAQASGSRVAAKVGGKVRPRQEDVNRRASTPRGVARTAVRSYLGGAATSQPEAAVADLEVLHLTSPIVAALARLGWRAESPLMHDAAPTPPAATTCALLLPPPHRSPRLPRSPVCCAAELGEGREGLVCAPGGAAWTNGDASFTTSHGIGLRLAHGDLTPRPPIDLLVGPAPETAQALQRRSALHAEAPGGRPCSRRPRAGTTRDAVAPLMQDLSKDARRIVLSSAPEQAAALVERYARRACARRFCCGGG